MGIDAPILCARAGGGQPRGRGRVAASICARGLGENLLEWMVYLDGRETKSERCQPYSARERLRLTRSRIVFSIPAGLSIPLIRMTRLPA